MKRFAAITVLLFLASGLAGTPLSAHKTKAACCEKTACEAAIACCAPGNAPAVPAPKSSFVQDPRPVGFVAAATPFTQTPVASVGFSAQGFDRSLTPGPLFLIHSALLI